MANNSTNVPILLGVCSVFFFLAYKVFLHQALYIYSPHYESGGSFMYYMSNATFLMIHISNFTFFGMFVLKDAGMQASSYLGITFIATILVKRMIQTKFIVPSQRIALTNARMIDEKNKVSGITFYLSVCSLCNFYVLLTTGARSNLEEKRVKDEKKSFERKSW